MEHAHWARLADSALAVPFRGTMTRSHLLTLAVLAATALSGQVQSQAQTSGTTATPHKKKPVAKHVVRKPVAHKETASEAEVRMLKERLDAQQAELDAMKQQLAARDSQITTTQQSVADAQSQAATANTAAAQATAAATDAQTKSAAVESQVTDLKATTSGLQDTVVANQARVEDEINNPTVFHYKGLNITPVAFFAFEGVFRNRSLNSDINTPFNSIPFPSANEGHVSELNFSGRQSRLGALFDGNAGKYHLAGYFEGDFLGTGTSSNNNQSNSYVFRQRQIWGQGSVGGFTVTGGQMWSLVTEDGVGTNNRTEKLPNTVDSQYLVGFSWERQPAIRFQQKFGDVKTGMFTAAIGLEQAQITGFNVASSVTAAIPTNFFFAGPGQNGGLYNAAGNIGNGNTASTGGITTYANNTAPDVVLKGALDFTHAHFELGGVGRFLRDFYFPITGLSGTAAAPVYTYAANYVPNTKSVGGIFGSIRVSPSKFADIAVQAMGGQGLGRYGSSQLADATLRPDGTLEPIRNYHGLFSLETHPTKKLDMYAYYGGEYAQRTVYATAFGTLIGYGAPNLNDSGCYALPANPGSAGGSAGSLTAVTCASPTRYIQEGMIGFTYRLVNSPKYGRLQYQATYSYLQRNLWSGSTTGVTSVANAPNPSPTGPRALDNMIHVGMRYYIP